MDYLVIFELGNFNKYVECKFLMQKHKFKKRQAKLENFENFMKVSIPLWLAENLSCYSILIIIGPRELGVNFLKKKITKNRFSDFSSKDNFFYIGLRLAKIFNKMTLRKLLEILLSIRFSLILETAFKHASGEDMKGAANLKDYDMYFFNIFLGKIKAIEKWKNNQI